VITRSPVVALMDIVEAVERVRGVLSDMPLDQFETDWQRQWLVERGVEIISEASRRLPGEMKARYPKIPWQKVAGIGNVLRHNYEKYCRANYVETGTRRFARFGKSLSRRTRC
jgi:uncharacterized protein with HEPN domain